MRPRVGQGWRGRETGHSEAHRGRENTSPQQRDAYVVRASGAPGQVWESLTFPLPRQMYDLTVAEAHTFFVGEEQWLVHNCNP